MADQRYVILHHRTRDGEHWDLMLEHGGVLLTWQLPRQPCSGDDLPLPARHIGDHRLAYLEYEGPVSGDRGTVKRVDSGVLLDLLLPAGRASFRLAGGRFAGAFELVLVQGDSWRLQERDRPTRRI